MYSTVTTSIHYGLTGVPIHVEADISEGLPCFDMVGFLSSEVREAKDRVRTALKNSGVTIPARRITINLTPANLRKTGNGCDLPVAAAVLAALGLIDEKLLMDYVVLGETSLTGNILPVDGVLSAAVMADQEGYQGVIVPWENAREAAILSNIKVIPVRNIQDFIRICQQEFPPECFYQHESDIWTSSYNVDFAEIYGQPLLRRACEIAVSGMHNLLMIGPPGSGKTMTAKRIPTILPELTQAEKLELSQIYSLCGMLDEERIIQNERPFRSPHHSATMQAIAGGGKYPRPGEISLAHHGVLFLDELPEFQKSTLEVLREPMEEKQIHISRLDGRITFPADFILVAAMNPCPCGFYPNMQRCNCTQHSINLYLNRISQALLDRIDLCAEAQELKLADRDRAEQPESSAVIRERVVRTHQIQAERYYGLGIQYNSQLSGTLLEHFCHLDTTTRAVMEMLYEEYQLTPRTYEKLLKVARTIADMEQEEQIQLKHIYEALCFRSPGKKYWHTEDSLCVR